MNNIPLTKKNQCPEVEDEYQWDEDDQCSEEKFVKRSQKSNFEGLNRGNWTQEENAQLAAFMDLNFDTFSNKKKRKDSKIFLVFSKLVKNRNPPQCRSHFQKKMKKFKTISAMINYYKDVLGIQRYRDVIEALKNKQKPRNEHQIPILPFHSEEPLRNQVKVEQDLPSSDAPKSDEEKYTNDSHQYIAEEFVGIRQYLKAFCMI